MSKQSKIANVELKISQEPNNPVMKLIKQTGIEGIPLDVIKAIMSPLINLFHLKYCYRRYIYRHIILHNIRSGTDVPH